ncbi:MAG: hypothetical protein AAF567_03225 [Actinomycetota bacterium]
MTRWLIATLAVVVMAVACSGSDSPQARELVTCENGIVVFAGVSCDVVSTDEEHLPSDIQDRIASLRVEADADPSKALGNAQSMMQAMARAPFSVCEALQTNPHGDFLQTENIAPVAAELRETTCPALEDLPE